MGHKKGSDGAYHITGHSYSVVRGSRPQVMHGTAYKTSGGLKKSEIMMNKNGRIVSRKKHNTAKKEKRLVRAGYGTKKGKFGFVKVGKSKSNTKSKSKKMRGGKGNYGGMNPMPLDEDVLTEFKN